MKTNLQQGFTLVELLVVIAIIGVLSSMILAAVRTASAKARDASRKTTLRELQKALESYFNDNNGYPTTGNVWLSSEAGDNVAYGGENSYVPGLVPTYMARLPRDPLGSNSVYCAGPPPWKRAYLYRSEGVNYKLLSHCAPEGGFSSSDPFFDSVRPTWAWRISTPGAAGW